MAGSNIFNRVNVIFLKCADFKWTLCAMIKQTNTHKQINTEL